MGVVLSCGRKDDVVSAIPPDEGVSSMGSRNGSVVAVPEPDGLPPVEEDSPIAGLQPARPRTYAVVLSRLAGHRFLGLRLEARQRALMAAAIKEGEGEVLPVDDVDETPVEWMSEGRRSQVVLLDERRLDLFIQPKLYAGELLDIVASHFHLKEKEFFGIAFINDANQYSWLQLDKRVLEHEFPKKATSQGATLILHFRVKYFVESIAHLKDAATVEAFYLQAKSLLAKGDIEADSETVFELAALVVQATYGDYVDDLMFKTHLRRLPVLPASVVKEYPSITLCEEKVLQHYKEITGQSRGAAIVNYLSIVESLPTYGQHYYEIKDKTGASCWLGLSYKGISQYDKIDRRNPKRVFLWKQLENLYYRDKKFTIEVHEARRVVHTLSSFNLYEDAIEEPVEDYDDLSDAICDPTTQVSVSRRTLAPANVTVYVWYASSPIVTKCIWSMAISQHHFFLDRKHLKGQSSIVPSLNQIASELCRSVQSLSSAGSLSNISRSNSSSSLPSTILGGEISEESKAAAFEMLVALRTRKEALEDVLTKKTEELKALCLKESELTGEIPPETPLRPGEAQPQVRRRIGTSFSLSDKLIANTKSKDRETLNDLELEYEIQSKIASASFQLMNDCTARKSARKFRKTSYDQATSKLREIEHKLCTLKREKNKEKAGRKHLGISESEKSSSDKDTLDDSGVHFAGSSSLSSPQSVSENSLKSAICGSSVVPSSSLPQLTVTECDPASEKPCDIRQRHQSLQQLPYSSVPKTNKGLDENSLYETCESVSSYRSRIDYDSVSCGSVSGLPLRVTYRNRFEPRLDIDGSNLYSVPNRRASQVFDSQDDLLLSGRKSGFECSLPIAKAQDGQPVYSNTLPLSSSYDDRLWYGKSKDQARISSDGSSLETSFEARSNNSCDTTSLSRYESSSQKQGSVGSPKNLPKRFHFHSENSLHCDESTGVTCMAENINCTESDHVQHLGIKKIAHVRSVPHLYGEPAEKLVHDQFSRNNVSNHNISQTVDLVQAPMHLQGSKRASSTCSLKYPSPKPKAKEWIETSLDSPLPPRKQKSRDKSETDKCHNKLQNNPSGASHSKVQSAGHSAFPKKINQAQPASRHYGRTEIEDHSLRCSNILATVMDTNCNSTYYEPQYGPDEKLSTVDVTSLKNCSYSTVEQNHSHAKVFQDNSDTVETTQCFPNDEASMYSEYCASTTLPYLNTNSSYPFPPPYHQAPTEHPVILNTSPVTTECPEHSVQVLPQSSNVDYAVSTSDLCDTHYRESNVGNSLSFNDPSISNAAFESSNSSSLNLCVSSSGTKSVSNPLVISSQPLQETDVCNIDMSYDSHNAQPLNINTAQEMTVQIPACSPVSFPFSSNVEVNVVSVGHFQPYWEETKPYELSDFYKYSTKHRKQQTKQNTESENTVKSDPVLTPNNGAAEYWTDTQSESLYPIEVTKGFASAPTHVPSTLKQNQEILVNAHVAVVKRSEYERMKNNCTFEESNDKQSVNSPPPSNEDSYNRVSLVDTFHDEMLAWYENRDPVKKATLV